MQRTFMGMATIMGMVATLTTIDTTITTIIARRPGYGGEVSKCKLILPPVRQASGNRLQRLPGFDKFWCLCRQASFFRPDNQLPIGQPLQHWLFRLPIGPGQRG